MKNSVEPATFRLVAQCLNQLRYRLPPHYGCITQKERKKERKGEKKRKLPFCFVKNDSLIHFTQHRSCKSERF